MNDLACVVLLELPAGRTLHGNALAGAQDSLEAALSPSAGRDDGRLRRRQRAGS